MVDQATFSYRDQRSTLLLNELVKDDAGWQRGHVVFGFDYSFPTTNRNQINLGPGAIVTQDGVKLFFNDPVSFTINGINPGGKMPVSDFPYPKNIIIGIQHNYIASTTTIAPKLVAIEVRVSQQDQTPAYYLLELDMLTLQPVGTGVLLPDPDRQAYNELYEQNPGGDGTVSGPTKQAWQNANSVLNNITPILKIRIQEVYGVSTAALPPFLSDGSGNPSTGVDVYRYKNLFENMNDLMGVNIFEPLIENDNNSPTNVTYTMTPTDQTFGLNTHPAFSSGQAGTPSVHPIYGTFETTDTNYSNYRFTSFLRDGRPLRESFQRLDTFLRLIVDRIGESSLVAYNQTLTEVADIVALGQSGNPVAYNGSDFVIQNGNVFYVNSSNTGDSHNKALSILDQAIAFISSRLGFTYISSHSMRQDINASTVTLQVFSLTNPSGSDWSGTNLTFLDAIEQLRNKYTSRGTDVITGTHTYSSNDSVRNSVPAGASISVTSTAITAVDAGSNSTVTTPTGTVTTDGTNTNTSHANLVSLTAGSNSTNITNVHAVLTDSTHTVTITPTAVDITSVPVSGTNAVRVTELNAEAAARASADSTLTTAVATINSTLPTLAPLASPALTGTPTAPTAAPGTNTTQVATTAFVQSALTEVIEYNASNTYNATSNVLVMLTAVGAGGGGASDDHHGGSGGGGGAIVNLPIALANGDSIAITMGNGGLGGSSANGTNGTATTVVITSAGSENLSLTLNGGTGAINTGSFFGVGGNVTYTSFDGTSTVQSDFPAGITGTNGFAGTNTVHASNFGGASALAMGGRGSNSTGPTPAVPGTKGSGGGGGDQGGNGGNGYALLTIVGR
jgi:hypothetical protein